MKLKVILLIALGLCTLLNLPLSAQTTTSINVEFSGIQRWVNVYAPQGSATDSVGLIIGLHGFGMSGQQFYNALYPAVVGKDYILASIDGAGDRHDDDLLGNEIHVIQHTIDSVCKHFSVDKNRIILTGFSYGGREALYYGTTFHELFSGIIPFSAGIQNEADALNNFPLPWNQPYNFNVVDSLPICNCYSKQDAGFQYEISFFDSVLSIYNALDTVITTNTLGHTIYYPAFVSDFQECLDFIESHSARLVMSSAASNSFRKATSPAVYRTEDGYVFNVDRFKTIEVYTLFGAKWLSGATPFLRYNQLPKGVSVAVVEDNHGKIFTYKLLR